MNSRSSPLLFFRLALGVVVANLLISVFTLKIDFFPSNLAYQCGIAFGAACAVFQLFAGRVANARFEQLSEETRDRMRGFLTTRKVALLALIQLLVGTAAFARGISGLYVWVAGEKVIASYTISRVYWNYSRYRRCFSHELEGLDSYTNITSAPCLSAALKAGSKMVFRGRKAALGFKYYDFSGEIDPTPPPH
jgi:hypothetical protein